MNIELIELNIQENEIGLNRQIRIRNVFRKSLKITFLLSIIYIISCLFLFLFM